MKSDSVESDVAWKLSVNQIPDRTLDTIHTFGLQDLSGILLHFWMEEPQERSVPEGEFAAGGGGRTGHWGLGIRLRGGRADRWGLTGLLWTVRGQRHGPISLSPLLAIRQEPLLLSLDLLIRHSHLLLLKHLHTALRAECHRRRRHAILSLTQQAVIVVPVRPLCPTLRVRVARLAHPAQLGVQLRLLWELAYVRPRQARALAGELSFSVGFEELVLHWFMGGCGGGSQAWKTHAH